MAMLAVIVGLAAAPIVLFLAALSSPAWTGFFWLSAAFALLVLLTVGANRFAEKRRTGWVVALGAMVAGMVAVGLVSPGAAPLLVGPVLVAAATATAVGIADALKPRHA